jgi:superfamily I DNA/RNA helicase
MVFRPSVCQEGVFDFIRASDGDGICNAVAGSGKTTTLVEGAQFLGEPALFLAYNKHIAETLQQRLTGTPMIAKTLHSIGLGVVVRYLGCMPHIDDKKYLKLARVAVERCLVPTRGTLQQQTVEALRDLTRYAQMTLANPRDADALDELAYHFGVEIDPHISRSAVYDLVPEVLARGMRIAGEGDELTGTRVIDFTDMLFLPYVWDLEPGQTRWVFVDEAQDLNAAQLDLALKCRAPGGRMLFVGDPRQAIYGFAGADAESFWTIQARTGAEELPLSICYRCPTSHLDLAREYVPEIEARPGAPAGTVEQREEEQLLQLVRAGDLILCRKTAPLLKTCFRLIKAMVPAKVRGRDIGRQITGTVRAVQRSAGYIAEGGWACFGDALGAYEQTMRAKLAQREGSEGQIAALGDRCEAVRVCYEEFDATSPDDLCARIEALFTDERSVVTLSTVHRAKGQENGRVLILHPHCLPMEWPKQQAWEAEQERNLRYVALTRSTDTLIFLHNPTAGDLEAQKLAAWQRFVELRERERAALVAVPAQ